MEIIRVALLDDDEQWLIREENYLKKFEESENIKFQFYHCKNSEELYVLEEEMIQIIFADIELGNENGIDLMKKISELFPGVQVIYVTNYLFYAVVVYETEHCYFVLKEQFEQRLPNIVKTAVNRMKQKIWYFTLVGGENFAINVDEILYFERRGHYTYIITEEGKYKIRNKLDELYEKEKTGRFLRCHVSFLVHINAIKLLRKNTIYLKNDVELPVSRRFEKNVRETFMNLALQQI